MKVVNNTWNLSLSLKTSLTLRRETPGTGQIPLGQRYEKGVSAKAVSVSRGNIFQGSREKGRPTKQKSPNGSHCKKAIIKSKKFIGETCSRIMPIA